MEYTCFEGMPLPILVDERSSTMDAHSLPSSASNHHHHHLLESFQQQQQQVNQSYNFYNPQLYNVPSVSWSTTDPTLLLTDQQRQQQGRAEFLFSSGANGNVKVACDSSGDEENMEIEASCQALGLQASFPTVQQLFHSRSSGDLQHHAAITGEQLNHQLHLHHGDMTTMSGRSERRDNALSSSSCSASSLDPFSFCVGGGGGGGGSAGVNASASQSQWMQQMCSLSSDQYYSCVDALMMPKLVSDHFTEQQQQQQQQQQRPCSYYASSASVNCLHEADSCGSSDRDRSTVTSEEINWMNSSSCNNSELRNLPNLHSGIDVAGVILSAAGPVELSDELSSSIVADDVELATTPTTLDHAHHHSAPAAAPSGRVSWMAAGIGSVQKSSSHVAATTLDPLLLLGSAAAAASPAQQQPQFSNGLLQAPRSALGPFKPQHRAYTLDCLPARAAMPFSFSASQNCSSSISPRYNGSVYSMPPVINPGLQGLVDNCTTSGSSFFKDFHSFSSTRAPQQVHHGAAGTSSPPGAAAGGAMPGVKEFSSTGWGLESRKDYCSDEMALLSGSRKPNATSIEPQSVAARHRRKKISERVRLLEKLIPGGSKMDTASMLDEAIDYVKFLQLQVQLLESMGEPETLGVHHGGLTTASAAAEGPRSCSFTTTAAMSTSTTSITASGNCSPFHPHNNCVKVDSSAPIGAGFGAPHHLNRSSSSMMQQVTIASATPAAPKPTSNSTPPLILSEVLQEQLFKQKLCLVSLRQYCPQGRAA